MGLCKENGLEPTEMWAFCHRESASDDIKTRGEDCHAAEENFVAGATRRRRKAREILLNKRDTNRRKEIFYGMKMET